MAMKLNAHNLFQFLTLIAPFLLMFTFTLVAFMDSEPLKALLYVGAVSIATFIIGLVPVGKATNEATNPLCKLWDLPLVNEARPSLSITFIAFTLVYMCMPMLLSGYINYPVFFLLLLLLVSDTVSSIAFNHCITFTNAVAAFILGSIFSMAVTGLIYATPMSDKLLYFSHVPSNKVFCSRPSKQTFKCSVYRNGKLIQNIN